MWGAYVVSNADALALQDIQAIHLHALLHALLHSFMKHVAT
jgi:hypothetical protein